MKTFIEKYFPTFETKEVKLFYVFNFFANGWFVLANWVFFFSKFLSIEQIGVIDGISILIGIIAEIPTGAIADLIGKKNTLVISRICHLIGAVLIVMGNGFAQFIIGNSLLFFGDALNSGAKDALVYDTLIEKKVADHYPKVLSTMSSIALIATVFVTFTGGLLYGLNFRFPWLAWIVFESIALLLLLKVKEPKVDTYNFSFKNYLRQNKEGFLHIFNSKMKGVLIFIIPIILLENLVSGIVRQGIGAFYGYSGETFGYLLSFTFLVVALISFKFTNLKNIFKEKGLVILTLLLFLIAFMISASGLVSGVIAGGVVVLLFSIGQIFCSMVTSLIANSRIESKYRATSLSSLALLNKIPYIIIALFFAEYTKIDGLHTLFNFFTILIAIILLVLTSIIIYKKNNY